MVPTLLSLPLLTPPGERSSLEIVRSEQRCVGLREKLYRARMKTEQLLRESNVQTEDERGHPMGILDGRDESFKGLLRISDHISDGRV